MIVLLTCKTSTVSEKVSETDVSFIEHQSYFELIFKPLVSIRLDNEIYYIQNYAIYIPKGFLKWRQLNNTVFLEYNNGQMIILTAGFTNQKREAAFHLDDINSKEFYDNIDCFDYIDFEDSTLLPPLDNRITNVYYDGKNTIILYNIRKEEKSKLNFLIKSFKELD